MHILKQEQLIPAPIKEVWKFFSSPYNLSKITPANLGFSIKNNPPSEIYPGLFITYTVSPLLSIPMTWVTEITHVENKKYFVDEQRVGPYKIWHHEHFFEAVGEKTLIKDLIHYKIGYGPLDLIINSLVVKPQLNEIFSYRKTAVETLYS